MPQREAELGPNVLAHDRHRLILCYHAVSEGWERPISVTPGQFEAQIRLLAKRGFRSSTFTEAVRGADRSEPVVAITFDDGYRSVFELAKPILDRYGMTATLFAPTGLMGTQQPMTWDAIAGWTDPTDAIELVPMSWDQLRELADAGWEIGSHGRTHPRMTTLDDQELEGELAGSKADLERELGRRCRSVAYPFGAFDHRVAAAAADHGFEAGATLAHGRPDPAAPLICPRVGVYLRDGGWRFRLKTGRLGPPLASTLQRARRDRTAGRTHPGALQDSVPTSGK